MNIQYQAAGTPQEQAEKLRAEWEGHLHHWSQSVQYAIEDSVLAERNRIRAALVEWLDVTGCIPKGTSYYHELLGCTDEPETV